MTYRKAFEQFQAKLAECKNGEEDQADVLAMFALEKQIPKKPKTEGACPCCVIAFCPCCKVAVEKIEMSAKYSYCYNCGQRLYWTNCDNSSQM